jgi:hypothetical protein
MVEKNDCGWIEITSHRRWFGDQRLGTWTVPLDGRVVGKLSPEGKVNLSSQPGAHVVRIRQWWYRSKPTAVQVMVGQTVSLEADIPRKGSILARMITFIVAPSRALTLTEIQ